MTVSQFVSQSGFKAVSLPHPEREIAGCYIGDLLSWVMGRCGEGDLWITIMSNVNVVAVSTLADAASVILAEGVTLDDEVLKVALEKGVNVLSTELSAYEAARAVAALI